MRKKPQFGSLNAECSFLFIIFEEKFLLFLQSRNIKAFDKAFVAAYCEETWEWEFGLNLANRSDGTCSIKIEELANKEVHSYIGFITENGKDVTDSLYTGLVKL